MHDILGTLRALRRPPLLIRAARIGLQDYRREVHLRRLLRVGPLPQSPTALIRLLAAPAAPASRPGAILGLLLLTAFVLWIASLAVRRMQISYGGTET